MTFTVSTADSSFSSLENLYSAPIENIGRKIKVTALAFLLFVASLNADAYDTTEHLVNDTKQKMEWVVREQYHNVVGSLFTDVQIAPGHDSYKLRGWKASDIWQQAEAYRVLRQSFYANFNEGQNDLEHFTPLFISMAKELRKLRIGYAFVDVSRKKDLIDFNLDLDEGIFLSVAKSVKEETDSVMFTIARKQKTLAYDEMSLSELVTKVSDVITELKGL